MNEAMAAAPALVAEAWQAYGDERAILFVDELSPHVSTNQVYRLNLSDGSRVIAKLSSYGSFVHFRQDHQLVAQWLSLMRGGPFGSLLARVLLHGERVFTHRGTIVQDGPHGQRSVGAWVVFYREAEIREGLARSQSDPAIVSL